jgi:hypothetical protein
MQAQDAPYLDTVLHEPHGTSRLFLEDDPPPTSVEYDASMPSVTKWASSASAIFLFLFLVLAGVGVALAWRLTDKPTVTPEGFAELQQQLKSVAADLSAVRHTLDQQSAAIDRQSAANHDQFTRIQEQISRQSIALLSASPLADKPTPPPKPAQHPAHVSTQDSSKPRQVAPPLPPKQ